MVGAGALVTGGTQVPAGSLILGVPGKVVRALDAAAIKGLEMSALHYQDNMRRFRRDLQVIS